MQTNFLDLMQALAPDLALEMGRRALVLERIADLQPVGRRQLAARLNLPEREVRTAAQVLKDEGFITLDAAGMSLTPKACEILEDARAFSRAMNGLTEMEMRLSRRLGIQRVCIAAGNADDDPQVLADVGRIAAARLRSMLQSGNTLAVTGGRAICQVAEFMPTGAPLNVMVVPARGGMGRTVEIQANTLAAKIAGKLGGHHRLIHMPDHMDPAALSEMLKVPDVREAVELLQRADVILHGIGRADETARHRNLSISQMRRLSDRGAVGEAFGNYFDKDGSCLYSSSSVGVDAAILKPNCRMIAVAAGRQKAEAILSVLRHYHHTLLVTDEAAAERILLLTDPENQ